MKYLYIILIMIAITGCEKEEIPVVENTVHLVFDVNNPDTFWIGDLEKPDTGWVETENGDLKNGIGEFQFWIHDDVVIVQSKRTPKSVVYWTDTMDRDPKPLEVTTKNSWEHQVGEHSGFTVEF